MQTRGERIVCKRPNTNTNNIHQKNLPNTNTNNIRQKFLPNTNTIRQKISTEYEYEYFSV